MFFMPESPVYLVAKGEDDRALTSLRWLRGQGYDSEGELKALKEDQRKQAEHGTVTLGELFTEKRYLMPLLVVIGLMFFQQFSGVNSVIFYTSRIFKQAGSDIDPGNQKFKNANWYRMSIAFPFSWQA